MLLHIPFKPLTVLVVVFTLLVTALPPSAAQSEIPDVLGRWEGFYRSETTLVETGEIRIDITDQVRHDFAGRLTISGLQTFSFTGTIGTDGRWSVSGADGLHRFSGQGIHYAHPGGAPYAHGSYVFEYLSGIADRGTLLFIRDAGAGPLHCVQGDWYGEYESHADPDDRGIFTVHVTGQDRGQGSMFRGTMVVQAFAIPFVGTLGDADPRTGVRSLGVVGQSALGWFVVHGDHIDNPELIDNPDLVDNPNLIDDPNLVVAGYQLNIAGIHNDRGAFRMWEFTRTC